MEISTFIIFFIFQRMKETNAIKIKNKLLACRFWWTFVKIIRWIIRLLHIFFDFLHRILTNLILSMSVGKNVLKPRNNCRYSLSFCMSVGKRLNIYGALLTIIHLKWTKNWNKFRVVERKGHIISMKIFNSMAYWAINVINKR